MAVGRLIRFVMGMGDYFHPDATEGSRYHRFIVGFAVSCGLALSLVFSGVMFGLWPRGKPFPPKYLLTPVVFFAIGAVFGAATACTFAPRRFLLGPSGRKWMALVGTESVPVARAVCGFFTLYFLGFVGLMIWAACSDYQRRML